MRPPNLSSIDTKPAQDVRKTYEEILNKHFPGDSLAVLCKQKVAQFKPTESRTLSQSEETAIANALEKNIRTAFLLAVNRGLTTTKPLLPLMASRVANKLPAVRHTFTTLSALKHAIETDTAPLYSEYSTFI